MMMMMMMAAASAVAPVPANPVHEAPVHSGDFTSSVHHPSRLPILGFDHQLTARTVVAQGHGVLIAGVFFVYVG